MTVYLPTVCVDSLPVVSSSNLANSFVSPKMSMVMNGTHDSLLLTVAADHQSGLQSNAIDNSNIVYLKYDSALQWYIQHTRFSGSLSAVRFFMWPT